MVFDGTPFSGTIVQVFVLSFSIMKANWKVLYIFDQKNILGGFFVAISANFGGQVVANQEFEFSHI